MAKKPKQPAHQCADARTLTEKEDETTGNNLVPVTQNTLNCAQARASARLTIHRDGDMETIVIDNQTFYRDVGIGRLCGLARPRDIRRRFAAMIDDLDIVGVEHLAHGRRKSEIGLSRILLAAEAKGFVKSELLRSAFAEAYPPSVQAKELADEVAGLLGKHFFEALSD